MKNIVKFLISVFLLLTPGIAFAQYTNTNAVSTSGGLAHTALDGTIREREITIPYVVTSTDPATCFLGRDCMVDWRPSVGATSLTITTTIGALPYAADVAIRADDIGSDTAAALSCTSLSITGVNQFGAVVTDHAVTTLSETFQVTNNAWDRILIISMSGCNFASWGTNDRIRMIVGRGIGVRNRIVKSGDILSVAYDPDGATATRSLVVLSPFSNNTISGWGFSQFTPNYLYGKITIPGTLGSAVSAGYSAGQEASSLIIRTRANPN